MTARVPLWVATGLMTALLAYWALYVIVAPVTTTDSHVYNLGRLLIAERGGLFANPLWTEFHQIYFPWAWDAVHYPLLKLGRLENLPSFAGFLGLLAIVGSVAARTGRPAALPLVGLMLLASPMVMFQATTTKNDFPLLVFLVAGLFFVERWRDEPRRLAPPAMAALCAAFAVGTKTPGLLVAALVVAAGLLVAAATRTRAAVVFLLALPVFLALLGSAETMINNLRQHGDWRGEPAFAARHKNPDGLAGAAANAIRYALNGLATGLESERTVRPYRAVVTEGTQRVLAPLGLRDAGLAEPYASGRFHVLLGNSEVASTFGPVGLAAALGSLGLMLRLSPRRFEWWLVAAGWLYLAGFCLAAGWSPFKLRSLVPAYGAWLIAVGLVVTPWLVGRPRALAATVAGLGILAVALPVFSWNRSPASIGLAWKNRERQMLRERVELADEMRLVRHAEVAFPGLPRVVVLGPNDWVLPFLQRKVPWLLWPNLHDRPVLPAGELSRLPGWPAGATEAIILVSQQPAVRVEGNVEVLRTTPAGSRLLRVRL